MSGIVAHTEAGKNWRRLFRVDFLMEKVENAMSKAPPYVNLIMAHGGPPRGAPENVRIPGDK